MSDPIATSDPTGVGSSGGKVEQAKNVAGDAVDRAHDVAGQATAGAKEVARDARAQLQDLVGRTRQNVDQEARTRSRQAAGSMRSFAEQLGALADGDTGGAGPLADYARQGRERMARLADRLDDRPSAPP